jgi:hypothetical protein
MLRAILVFTLLMLASCSIEPEPVTAAAEAETQQRVAKPAEGATAAEAAKKRKPAEAPEVKEEPAAKHVAETKTAVKAEPARPEVKAEPAVKPEPAVPAPKPRPVRVKKPAPKPLAAALMAGKHVIGAVEPVRVIPGDFVFTARIDTGAKTSSMHAEEIQQFERDGKRWVRFKITDGTKSRVVEKRVVRRVRIKQQIVPSERRPVVKMRFIIGGVSQSIQVTLTDRSNFKYKVLVGRNFLHDLFIVDVGQKMTTQPIPYEK